MGLASYAHRYAEAKAFTKQNFHKDNGWPFHVTPEQDHAYASLCEECFSLHHMQINQLGMQAINFIDLAHHEELFFGRAGFFEKYPILKAYCRGALTTGSE